MTLQPNLPSDDPDEPDDRCDEPDELHARRRWRAVRPRPERPRLRYARHLRGELAEAGMATAEYAIATLAAVNAPKVELCLSYTALSSHGS
ncbi:DUF4244 domain-containing protein [Cellulomonas sp. JH27-2]|uniref:DUF4244 domain-containing protein n=1 Tax=Cellulomonas sp. JH27-2 TaxID=2774139 RepID=UPI00177DE93A|nr:DUF4244 domain-containing protein [Cellulomonas sp. JH27-2]MBD8057530.1 DUF4244 domain-containing protein [Cellulomonas sp. JH27-2]